MRVVQLLDWPKHLLPKTGSCLTTDYDVHLSLLFQPQLIDLPSDQSVNDLDYHQ